MAAEIDPTTRRNLILVKQLYQRAVIQAAAPHSRVDRVLAVIGFDLAVETAIKSVVRALDPSRPPAQGFDGLIQQAQKAMAAKHLPALPDVANIMHIHSIRNDTQHKAKDPDPATVSDCRTYARDFLDKLVRSMWDMGFEDISLVDVIKHEKARGLLKKAETALAKRKFIDSVKNAIMALELAISYVRPTVSGYFDEHFTTGIVVESFAQGYKSDERALRMFLQMRDSLVYLMLNMNYLDYIRCKDITGAVRMFPDGKIELTNRKRNLDENDAQYVVSYCAETVAQIEDRVGDLEKPFGRSDWW